MPVTEEFLESVTLFTGVAPDLRRELADLANERSWTPKEVVFREGDPGESLFLVVEGAVELTTEVGEDIERPVITVRPGSVFGLVELLDPQPRVVSARAADSSTTLEIDRSSLMDFIHADPASRHGVVAALATGLARHTHIAMDLLRQNMAWTLEVSGAAQLNLHRLMGDRVRIVVDRVRGDSLAGTLLKVEPSAAGYDLLVKTDEDRVHLVPYHAVTGISFGAKDIQPEEDTLPDM